MNYKQNEKINQVSQATMKVLSHATIPWCAGSSPKLFSSKIC